MDNPIGLQPKERNFIQSAFKDYYRRSLVAPPDIYAREFGFGFDKKIDFRHRAFGTAGQLQDFIQREAPLFISYSAAYYKLPAAQPMPKKEFLGADLIFDLDANTAHDGHNPVFCGACFAQVREECIQLLDEFLMRDFGFSQDELSVNFSGQKGFHIHLRTPKVRNLNAEARRQLIEYVTAAGIDVSTILRKQKVANDEGRSVEVLRGPGDGSRGWSGKLYRTATSLVERGDLEELRALGFTRGQAAKIVENKTVVLAKMRQGNWDYLRGMDSAWQNVLDGTMKMKSVEVDRNVTFDLARLIRLPESLHGDTGFIAKNMKLAELAVFDPTRDATAFDSAKPIRIAAGTEPIEFDFAGRRISLAAGEQKTLPASAAMLLLCKKKAVLATA